MSICRVYLTFFVLFWVSPVMGSQCLGLFSVKTLGGGKLQYVKKQAPVRQCVGTCYVEATMKALNYALQNRAETPGEISRLYTVAQIALNRVRMVLESKGPEYFYESTLVGNVGLKKEMWNPGSVDFISGGQSHNVQTSAFNKGLLFLKRNPTHGNISRENKEIESLIGYINGEMYSVRREIKEYMGRERLEFDRISKSYFEQVGQLSPRHSHFIEQLISEGNFRYSSLVKIIENIIRYRNSPLLSDVVDKPIADLFVDYARALEALHEQRVTSLSEDSRVRIRSVQKSISNRIKTMENAPGVEIKKVRISDFSMNINTRTSHVSPAEAQRALIHNLKKYGVLSLGYVHARAFMRSQQDGWPYLVAEKDSPTLFDMWKLDSPVAEHVALITGVSLNSRGQIEYLEIQQSWGPYFGKLGSHRMTFDYFMKYAKAIEGFQIKDATAGLF